MSDPTKQPPSQPALVCEKCGGYGWHPIHDAEGTEIGTPECEACGGTGRSKEANPLGSAAWSSTPPTGPGYFWSRSHGGTPVIAWHTDGHLMMSCGQTVTDLDSDEGRDWMATQAVEFWPEPIVFAGKTHGTVESSFWLAYDWRMENGLAVLYQRGQTPWRYNLHNLQIALQNVKSNRKSYATQSAWERQVRMFEAGIALMSANREMSHGGANE